MDAFSVEFDFSEFNGKLDQLGKIVIDEMMKSVWLAGEALRGDSVEIVPFDHGFDGGLAGSASTEKAEMESAGVISATVGYNKVYAAKLHEDMTLHIKQTHAGAAPRQQKYIENPARENAEKYGRIIHDGLARALNG